jgi:hypothetical protein
MYTLILHLLLWKPIFKGGIIMKEMFQDYKTMVVEPRKEFDELYKKEIILIKVAVYAVLICGSLVVSNREKIKETIKSKFNNGKRI